MYIVHQSVLCTFVNLTGISKGQQREMVFWLNQAYTVYDSKRASKIFILLSIINQDILKITEKEDL